MPKYRIYNRFDPHIEVLEFNSITLDEDDNPPRAGIGRWGFLGSGIPMLPEERREFARMVDEGQDRYIGTNKVLEIA